jgi:CRISPR-associated protein Csd1
LWDEIAESRANLSFTLEADTQLVSQREAVYQKIQEPSETQKGKKQACAVSGEFGMPAALHQAIKGVWGAQSVGANIVSFNLDAFRSFGKKQGLNAPVSEETAFAYTTALNHLLRKGSHQRMQVGDASTVFWAKEAHAFEDDFSWFLGEPAKGEEAVSYGKIRALLSAVKTGALPEEDSQQFYVLGLAPNAARISIRFWYTGDISDLKHKIAQHFQDIELVRAPHDREFLSLFQLLVSTATEGKADNIPPNLGGNMARSVLSGGQYPRTLLANAIRRCKAEQRITHARASVIKGVLARNARITRAGKQEVGMALDKQYDNIGYVLGRLFAALERIQEQAQGRGLNKTIRDTYFGAAASSPLVTFKRLQDLAVHHLAKIRNSGKATVWLEQLMQEINGHIPPHGVPSILSLEDQGRFSIGYYHQRQDFFTKNDNEGGDE